MKTKVRPDDVESLRRELTHVRARFAIPGPYSAARWEELRRQSIRYVVAELWRARLKELWDVPAVDADLFWAGANDSLAASIQQPGVEESITFCDGPTRSGMTIRVLNTNATEIRDAMMPAMRDAARRNGLSIRKGRNASFTLKPIGKAKR